MGEIYSAKCIQTNKFYIGKAVSFLSSGVKRGSRQRWKDHISEAINNNSKSQCTYLNNAIRKYGPESFEIEVIFTTTDESELNELEINFIKEYDSIAPNGYNLTHGDEGNRPSDITRQKMSAWQKGKPKSEKHKKSMSEYAKNRPPEHTEKIRLKNIGRKATKETKIKMSKLHMKLKLEDYDKNGVKQKEICELYNISEQHCRKIRNQGWRPKNIF